MTSKLAAIQCHYAISLAADRIDQNAAALICNPDCQDENTLMKLKKRLCLKAQIGNLWGKLGLVGHRTLHTRHCLR